MLLCSALGILLLQVLCFQSAFGIVCKDKDICLAKANEMKDMWFKLFDKSGDADDWNPKKVSHQIYKTFFSRGSPFLTELKRLKHKISHDDHGDRHRYKEIIKSNERSFFLRYNFVENIKYHDKIFNLARMNIFDGIVDLCRTILRDARHIAEPYNNDNNSSEDSCDKAEQPALSDTIDDSDSNKEEGEGGEAIDNETVHDDGSSFSVTNTDSKPASTPDSDSTLAKPSPDSAAVSNTSSDPDSTPVSNTPLDSTSTADKDNATDVPSTDADQSTSKDISASVTVPPFDNDSDNTDAESTAEPDATNGTPVTTPDNTNLNAAKPASDIQPMPAATITQNKVQPTSDSQTSTPPKPLALIPPVVASPTPAKPIVATAPSVAAPSLPKAPATPRNS